MGITVLIARYLGEKREDQIGSIIGGGTVVFTAISLVLFVIMVGFARPIAVLMQAPVEAVELTAAYIRICGAGIFFIVAYNVLSAIFRGLGDSNSPLLFVFVACIVNIVGDLVLVAGLGMDAMGAALATVFAQALSVVFAIVRLVKKGLPFTITRHDFRWNPQCSDAVHLLLRVTECRSQQTETGKTDPVYRYRHRTFCRMLRLCTGVLQRRSAGGYFLYGCCGSAERL